MITFMQIQFLEKLWNKFETTPTQLTHQEYRVIVDTVQHMYNIGFYSKIEAKTKIDLVMEVLQEVATTQHAANNFVD